MRENEVLTRVSIAAADAASLGFPQTAEALKRVVAERMTNDNQDFSLMEDWYTSLFLNHCSD